MPSVIVQITKFVDKYPPPGIVECELVDANGITHQIIEKVPYVSQEDLWSTNSYPRRGAIRCIVEAKYQRETGHEILEINTDSPDGVESTFGVGKFFVLSLQAMPDQR